ncbi:hypothetical protein B7R21_18410 [Subtercola boreus]|uniref:Uncharacterized protein n=1 Tax=Subtercola boreus TaxID=120213 RepID=A0A3E0VBS1_9MICO|nr:DUF6188 family protein [Subtercola boreus]RFA06820.1 hypothetical protein B7R21_18410 [Subtercola boreus]
MSDIPWGGPTSFPCIVPVVGQTVTQVLFDYAVTILFEGGQQLRLETAFQLGAARVQPVTVAPEVSLQAAASILGVLHSSVANAVLEESGQLVLEFSSGETLTIGPDESYEAFTFNGSHGELLVALPGGGLTFFSGRSK